MEKQLLIEYSLFKPTSTINESYGSNKGNMIVSGLVQACDKPNQNKRIYPYRTLYEQVEKYINGPIRENRALGELDHPESQVINLKNVSHNIKRLYWKGKDLHGDIEILPTPSGNIVKELFKNNIVIGISSRAMGSTTPIGEGLVQVEDDLDLICWDFVSTPSTFGAYMIPTSGINESYQRKIENKYFKINKIMSDIICTQSGVCCIK
jgi:hypothetical protein